MKSDTLYGDFLVKLMWRLSGVFKKKTWQIGLPDNIHINFTIKCQLNVSHSILSPYRFHNLYQEKITRRVNLRLQLYL